MAKKSFPNLHQTYQPVSLAGVRAVIFEKQAALIERKVEMARPAAPVRGQRHCDHSEETARSSFASRGVIPSTSTKAPIGRESAMAMVFLTFLKLTPRTCRR